MHLGAFLAAAGCAGSLGAVVRCRCCVRLGAWVVVPLQGAAAVCAWGAAAALGILGVGAVPRLISAWGLGAWVVVLLEGGAECRWRAVQSAAAVRCPQSLFAIWGL